jgi:DNA-binding response OmpR family regulator
MQYFPLPPLQPSSSRIAAKKARIMIVDDEPDVTDSFGLTLEDTGLFDVKTYNESLEALSPFQANSYDLLLLDIKMPRMDGFELYEKIKKIDNKVKACFTSAFDIRSAESREQVNALETECFIPKPVQIKELVQRIETELLR